MSVTRSTEKQGDALDVLEVEDLHLRRLFAALRNTRGSSVEERSEYGDLAKSIVRHLATREAALVDLSAAAGADPALGEVANRFERSMSEHRPYIDRVEKMSRGVQGINLRVGQDFDGEMEDLMQVVGTEVEWELDEAVPLLKGALGGEEREALKSAAHLATHAPTNLNPGGPRWWEGAPFVSRIITVYDRLRDFPRARNRR